MRSEYIKMRQTHSKLNQNKSILIKLVIEKSNAHNIKTNALKCTQKIKCTQSEKQIHSNALKKNQIHSK